MVIYEVAGDFPEGNPVCYYVCWSSLTHFVLCLRFIIELQHVPCRFGEYSTDREENVEALFSLHSWPQWAQAQLPFPLVAITYFSYILHGLVMHHPNFPYSLREIIFFSITFFSSRFFHLLWLQTKFSLAGAMCLQITVFEDISNIQSSHWKLYDCQHFSKA